MECLSNILIKDCKKYNYNIYLRNFYFVADLLEAKSIRKSFLKNAGEIYLYAISFLFNILGILVYYIKKRENLEYSYKKISLSFLFYLIFNNNIKKITSSLSWIQGKKNWHSKFLLKIN